MQKTPKSIQLPRRPFNDDEFYGGEFKQSLSKIQRLIDEQINSGLESVAQGQKNRRKCAKAKVNIKEKKRIEQKERSTRVSKLKADLQRVVKRNTNKKRTEIKPTMETCTPISQGVFFPFAIKTCGDFIGFMVSLLSLSMVSVSLSAVLCK